VAAMPPLIIIDYNQKSGVIIKSRRGRA